MRIVSAKNPVVLEGAEDLKKVIQDKIDEYLHQIESGSHVTFLLRNQGEEEELMAEDSQFEPTNIMPLRHMVWGLLFMAIMNGCSGIQIRRVDDAYEVVLLTIQPKGSLSAWSN